MEISWKTTFLPFRLVGPSCSFLENEIEVPIHGIYNPHSSLSYVTRHLFQTSDAGSYF